MAACPVRNPLPSHFRRRPLALTHRRLEANRRNAAHSTGPRTAEGKARVARNGVKHGFFVATERWTPQQQRDFAHTFAGLRDELQPRDAAEESCVRTIAQSYLRMASIFRYENVAALKYFERRERELNARITAADPAIGARLRGRREELRRAGLWRPTIAAPREARAIIRYSSTLERSIRRATTELEGRRNLGVAGMIGRRPTGAKVQKQTHFAPSPDGGQTTVHGLQATPRAIIENAKANPLTSMFTGNRHQRRRAKALAKRRT
jgi:hypothetical protein